MDDPIEGDLSAAEMELLIHGLSDDVSFFWVLHLLGLIDNPPKTPHPDAQTVETGFATLQRLNTQGLIEVGSVRYVDPQTPRGTLAPVEHTASPSTS